MSLALAESRSTCDGLTELLGKYESNNTALQLSLSYTFDEAGDRATLVVKPVQQPGA